MIRPTDRQNLLNDRGESQTTPRLRHRVIEVKDEFDKTTWETSNFGNIDENERIEQEAKDPFKAKASR